MHDPEHQSVNVVIMNRSTFSVGKGNWRGLWGPRGAILQGSPVGARLCAALWRKDPCCAQVGRGLRAAGARPGAPERQRGHHEPQHLLCRKGNWRGFGGHGVQLCRAPLWVPASAPRCGVRTPAARRWDEDFELLVHDPEHQSVNVVIMNRSTFCVGKGTGEAWGPRGAALQGSPVGARLCAALWRKDPCCAQVGRGLRAAGARPGAPERQRGHHEPQHLRPRRGGRPRLGARP